MRHLDVSDFGKGGLGCRGGLSGSRLGFEAVLTRARAERAVRMFFSGPPARAGGGDGEAHSVLEPSPSLDKAVLEE